MLILFRFVCKYTPYPECALTKRMQTRASFREIYYKWKSKHRKINYIALFISLSLSISLFRSKVNIDFPYIKDYNIRKEIKMYKIQAGRYGTDFNRMYMDALLVLLTGKKVIIPKRKK